MNFEVEAAFERLLAMVPEETHAVFRSAKHRLGMSQLIAEEAARCGVEIVLPDEWFDDSMNCGLPEERFTFGGVTVRLWTPVRPKKVYADTSPFRPSDFFAAPTLGELFDRIMEEIRFDTWASASTADAAIESELSSG